jgi:hypothetical protein
MNFARLLSSSSSIWRAQEWLVLAVLIGFLEVRERWKKWLSRTRTTTKDEDDLVAAASRCKKLFCPEGP